MLDRIKKLRSHIIRLSVGVRLVTSWAVIMMLELKLNFRGDQKVLVTTVLSFAI